MHKIFEHISDIVIGLLIFAVLVGAISAATKTAVPTFFSNMVTEMQQSATGLVQDATSEITPDTEP